MKDHASPHSPVSYNHKNSVRQDFFFPVILSPVEGPEIAIKWKRKESACLQPSSGFLLTWRPKQEAELHLQLRQFGILIVYYYGLFNIPKINVLFCFWFLVICFPPKETRKATWLEVSSPEKFLRQTCKNIKVVFCTSWHYHTYIKILMIQ